MELENEAAVGAVELPLLQGRVVAAELHVPVAVLVHLRPLQVLEYSHVVPAPPAI